MVELSANDTCALNENEQKRRSNLVQQVYVEYLMKASRRRCLNLVRTSPEHLTKASRRRSLSLVRGTSRVLNENKIN